MGSNSNQPDAPNPQVSSNAGEFTQIFAGGAMQRPENTANKPLPPASTEDEFERLFSRAPEPPQMSPAAEPSQDATLIFTAITAPVAVATDPRLPQPTSPPAPVANTARTPTHTPAPPSSEFTQIFSAIAPPPSSAPESVIPSAPPAPPSGEFTQFFSAISQRQAAAARPAATPFQAVPATAGSDRVAEAGTPASLPAPPPAAPVRAEQVLPLAPPASAEVGFTQMFQQSPAVSGRDLSQTRSAAESPAAEMTPSTAAWSAGASTQIFQPTPLATQPAPVAPPANDAGSFTQIFQQLPTPPVGHATPIAAVPSQPNVPVSRSAPPVATNAPAPEWPAFGPPPPPSGSFTDIFTAQPAQSTAAPPPRPATPGRTLAAQDGAFTELFQANPGSPQSRADASVLGSRESASSQGANWPVPSASGSDAGWPSASAPSSAPLAAGGGEFTRLMQSLTPSAGAGTPPPVSNDPFFTPAPGPAASNSGHESEFTRVLRGSSQRDQAGPPPPALSPAASAPAPGMAMQQQTKAEAAEKPVLGKSKTMIILLVAMNALLLVALIVIAFLVLRRK